MNIKPILFNTDMVRAILDGRKTQARRIIEPQFKEVFGYDLYHGADCLFAGSDNGNILHIPMPIECRDTLWVREPWAIINLREKDCFQAGYIYKAADPPNYDFRWVNVPQKLYEKYLDMPSSEWSRWHPSIHMPKEAARIFLRVTHIYAERLQDITDNEAYAEGVAVDSTTLYDGIARDAYARLWDGTIKPANRDKHGWDANPWVWVITFERCEKPDNMEEE